MSYDGSGTFSLPAGNPVTTLTAISSSVHNTTLSEIATGLSTAITKDGQTTVTANLPMAGYRHTGVGNPTARTQYATAAGAQDGTYAYLSSVSGTNTITATAALSMSAYATGQVFAFVPAVTNTGATTINLNSIGAKNVFFQGAACAGGELTANVPVIIFYDGTQFNIVGPAPTLRAGSASAPSLFFAGDANTGLWSPGANIIACSTDGTERWRVTAIGNLVVGGTAIIWDEQAAVRSTAAQVLVGAYSSSAAYNTSAYRSQVETAAGTGWMHFQGRVAGGGVVVNIYGNGDIQNTNNSYGAISDGRLKENISDARNYLADLRRVRVRKYSWKADHKQQADQLGIVAQELAEVFPGLVTEEEDKDARGRPTGTRTKGIKYSLLVPMLLTAVQALADRVEALESR